MEDKRFYLPYPIEDEATRESMLRKGVEVTYFNFGNKRCLVGLVKNNDEKVYRDFIKETWSDLKRKENETRCLIPDKEGGGYIICHGDCSKCPKERSGRPDSLDFQEQETGIEVADHSSAFEERVALKVTFEYLLAKLRAENPQYADLIEMMYKDCSQEEIAISTNKSTGTIGEQATRAVNLAKEIYENSNK